MKKIMLVCAAGMSTSLMVNKMQKAADNKDEEIEVFAAPEAEAQSLIEQVDVIMLGPQVSYIKKNFEEAAKPYNIPVTIIEATDYGRMNGEKVLNIGLKLIEESKS
ncbi:PTS system cellobiose-specific IIB component [Breznakia sp. PF5-3]|uniref:PTS sugar transporter subunit IIB n=1 Tax=unclassified Breznakia TaxID=2623764 RepID=UPI002407043E|nr:MULTISPECIES: PTS sugar transporter subunit IIB [unclassified Breznakia]MDL2276657.1 PTS sugar transporter subunit IIB [Breznakia sp. OttesenSCG-928-G09]MDF9824831.1 PTS system cellobiose-specific IIB component [Breznakia sp. PM6-1]MDF9835207.1 PTS system cellobiose-specific IIB component [Breznakia sp. PF5-3]MDF9837319.1 PTS system cellobiose-specific IIB component [Breznakia sp. PFB2-8]MDF9859757.1 PTS system cellobiose-specific IIB component [Breznakia sp. PH5-24]